MSADPRAEAAGILLGAMRKLGSTASDPSTAIKAAAGQLVPVAVHEQVWAAIQIVTASRGMPQNQEAQRLVLRRAAAILSREATDA